MNIIKEALKFPKELRNFLEDVLNEKDEICRCYGMKFLTLVAGNNNFTVDKIAKLVPLQRVIE